MAEPDIHFWREPSYLSRGNSRQRKAYHALQELRVMQALTHFNPVLVGTIPIGIDIPGSDLDIICDADDLKVFSNVVTNEYGDQKGFLLKTKFINGLPSAIASFHHIDFPIQIFAQPCLVEQQNAFRHMLVEARLLKIGGSKAQREIRKLKRSGMKTEPAFARYFKLIGDPYMCLLELSVLSVEDLIYSLNPK